MSPVKRALEYYTEMSEKFEADKVAIKLKEQGRRISLTIDPKVRCFIYQNVFNS